MKLFSVKDEADDSDNLAALTDFKEEDLKQFDDAVSDFNNGKFPYYVSIKIRTFKSRRDQSKTSDLLSESFFYPMSSGYNSSHENMGIMTTSSSSDTYTTSNYFPCFVERSELCEKCQLLRKLIIF